MKIQKILVANRGEIAQRIIKTIRELGLDSVAIYSDADIDGIHVHSADEAVFISNGYLDQDQIIQRAKEMNVEGYPTIVLVTKDGNTQTCNAERNVDSWKNWVEERVQ